MSSSDVGAVLKERGAKYGAFRTHAHRSQLLKEQVIDNWVLDSRRPPALNDTLTEGMEMILHKIARIVNGDPYYKDNWVDIAGYAQLVADELK